jgi:uncharacterized protein (TIGR00251 family)
MIRPTATGVDLDLRVIPRARKTGLAGERDGRLLVRLVAPPLEGAANDALISFLAGLLKVPRRAVRIVAGERGRQKRVAIDGLDPETVRARLLADGGSG